MAAKVQTKINSSTHLLELMLSQTDTYHHHKETMANAGMVTQIAVVSGVLSLNKEQLGWVQTWCVPPVVMFILIWLLIHVFIRWQLRNRRWAALFSAALTCTLREWAIKEPSSPDLDPYKLKINQPTCYLLEFLDKYVIPCRSILVPADVSREGWPTALVNEWNKREEESKKEIALEEWLLTVGSFLTLFLGLMKIYHF